MAARDSPLHVEGCANLTVGGDLHVHPALDDDIPRAKSRRCPQCERRTWARTRHCRVCGFDLQRWDQRRAPLVLAGASAVLCAWLALEPSRPLWQSILWGGFAGGLSLISHALSTRVEATRDFRRSSQDSQCQGGHDTDVGRGPGSG